MCPRKAVNGYETMWGKDIFLTTLSRSIARTFIKLGPLASVKFRVLPRVRSRCTPTSR